MSNLILKPKEFEHLKEKSSYNYNFYQHKELKYIILENCHEDYNFNEYSLVEQDKKTFLGCSQSIGGDDLGSTSEEIHIDFMLFYT